MLEAVIGGPTSPVSAANPSVGEGTTVGGGTKVWGER